MAKPVNNLERLLLGGTKRKLARRTEFEPACPVESQSPAGVPELTPIGMNIAANGCIDLSEYAWMLFHSPEPEKRFSALCFHQVATLAFLRNHGASRKQVWMADTLNNLLTEALQGNFANPMWPEKKDNRNTKSDKAKRTARSNPTFDRSMAYSMLMGLIECRIALDNLSTDPAQNKNARRVAEPTTLGCSHAANDLDDKLERAGLSVEKWVNGYCGRGDTTGSDEPRLKDGDRTRHKMTRRLEDWYGGEPPAELSEGKWAEQYREATRACLKKARDASQELRLKALTEHYNDLLEITALFMTVSARSRRK